jgi:hypothetical protein
VCLTRGWLAAVTGLERERRLLDAIRPSGLGRLMESRRRGVSHCTAKIDKIFQHS